MPNITGSTTQYIPAQDYLQKDNTKNVAHEESRSVLSVTALAEEKGGLSMMLDKQSLRTDDSRAMSASLKRKGGDVEGEPAAKAVKLSTAGEGDSRKAELLAGTAASVMPPQNNITQANNKPSESKGTEVSTANGSSSVAGQKRSHSAVEGGTDITGASPAKRTFINVIGSDLSMQVANSVQITSLSAERTQSIMGANASVRGLDAAVRSGEHLEKAAQQNMIGSITSGVERIGGGLATAGSQMKALGKEAKSIKTNLSPSRNMELGVSQSKTSINAGKDTMVHQGKALSGDTQAVLSQSHAGDLHTSATLRDSHNKVQLDTTQSRIRAEYGNQVINAGAGITEAGFGVAAAAEQKESKLADANREVEISLANVHSQVEKKNADNRKSTLDALSNALDTNLNTVSSMAERT
ncbi:MAG TPA: hypothetical protein VGH05_06365 [Buttiauxella sp.]|jgi:hypothetical protein